MNPIKPIPHPTLRRYPIYIQILRQLQEEGKTYASSSYIAGELGREPVQVRKDLALCNITGQPRKGFNLKELLNKLETALGWNNLTNAILVGTGNIGSALAGYASFSTYGLEITALFDQAPNKVGTAIHDKIVLPLEKLTELTKRLHIRIGIIAVPDQAAQSVADLMVSAGIKGIWNFSNKKLKLPETILVEKVDLAASLAVLYNKLKNREETNGNNNG